MPNTRFGLVLTPEKVKNDIFKHDSNDFFKNKKIQNNLKAAVLHLSSKNEKYSWNNTTEKEKDNGCEIIAVNDPAESSFGPLTDQIHQFGCIKIQHAGGMIQLQQKGNFARNIDLKKVKLKQGKIISYYTLFFFT